MGGQRVRKFNTSVKKLSDVPVVVAGVLVTIVSASD
jgi:hypothetical protein